VTNSGVELNPVLRRLIEINPFFVYPFLLSTLIPILLFRFNKVVEYGVAALLITISLVASFNNIGIMVSRYSQALPVLENMDIQFYRARDAAICSREMYARASFSQGDARAVYLAKQYLKPFYTNIGTGRRAHNCVGHNTRAK
jgi:hypothetical protein